MKRRIVLVVCSKELSLAKSLKSKLETKYAPIEICTLSDSEEPILALLKAKYRDYVKLLLLTPGLFTKLTQEVGMLYGFNLIIALNKEVQLPTLQFHESCNLRVFHLDQNSRTSINKIETVLETMVLLNETVTNEKLESPSTEKFNTRPTWYYSENEFIENESFKHDGKEMQNVLLPDTSSKDFELVNEIKQQKNSQTSNVELADNLTRRLERIPSVDNDRYLSEDILEDIVHQNNLLELDLRRTRDKDYDDAQDLLHWKQLWKKTMETQNINDLDTITHSLVYDQPPSIQAPTQHVDSGLSADSSVTKDSQKQAFSQTRKTHSQELGDDDNRINIHIENKMASDSDENKKNRLTREDSLFDEPENVDYQNQMVLCNTSDEPSTTEGVKRGDYVNTNAVVRSLGKQNKSTKIKTAGKQKSMKRNKRRKFQVQFAPEVVSNQRDTDVYVIYNEELDRSEETFEVGMTWFESEEVSDWSESPARLVLGEYVNNHCFKFSLAKQDPGLLHLTIKSKNYEARSRIYIENDFPSPLQLIQDFLELLAYLTHELCAEKEKQRVVDSLISSYLSASDVLRDTMSIYKLLGTEAESSDRAFPTLLHYAAANNFKESLKVLFSHKDWRFAYGVMDNNGKYPNDIALRNGYLEADKMINEALNSDPIPESIYASMKNNDGTNALENSKTALATNVPISSAVNLRQPYGPYFKMDGKNVASPTDAVVKSGVGGDSPPVKLNGTRQQLPNDTYYIKVMGDLKANKINKEEAEYRIRCFLETCPPPDHQKAREKKKQELHKIFKDQKAKKTRTDSENDDVIDKNRKGSGKSTINIKNFFRLKTHKENETKRRSSSPDNEAPLVRQAPHRDRSDSGISTSAERDRSSNCSDTSAVHFEMRNSRPKPPTPPMLNRCTTDLQQQLRPASPILQNRQSPNKDNIISQSFPKDGQNQGFVFSKHRLTVEQFGQYPDQAKASHLQHPSSLNTHTASSSWLNVPIKLNTAAASNLAEITNQLEDDSPTDYESLHESLIRQAELRNSTKTKLRDFLNQPSSVTNQAPQSKTSQQPPNNLDKVRMMQRSDQKPAAELNITVNHGDFDNYLGNSNDDLSASSVPPYDAPPPPEPQPHSHEPLLYANMPHLFKLNDHPMLTIVRSMDED